MSDSSRRCRCDLGVYLGAVTSVIIGPRTPERLSHLLTGADIGLGDDVLDQIDEIVPPGANLNPDDIYLSPPALVDKRLRRR